MKAVVYRDDPLDELRHQAASCHNCGLWERATQTVFGEGPAAAPMVLVGEQPGEQEDLAGRPFVGPAGQVLAAALDEAGIERSGVYVTNAVKHFKWTPRGKRRIHDKPNRTEVTACLPWLRQELRTVSPAAVVTLGATAAQALLGSSFRLTQHRGEVLRDTDWAPNLVATIHPSALLRLPDASAREQGRRELASDLRVAASCCGLIPDQPD